MQTFLQYLNTPVTLVEDLDQEIARLTAELSTVDTQINQRTQPLLQRKAQLQKLLAVKQKQRGTASQQSQEPTQQNTASQTTTPGSSGVQTPGSQRPTR